MRIRKRLALCSSPTPPPLSDLQLRRSEAAPPSSHLGDPPKPPSDQNHRWAFPKYEEKLKQKDYSLQEFGDDIHVNTNNDIRKIVSICHGEEGFNTNMQPSSSSLQESYCGEAYKLVPLKKRKGIFERNPNEEAARAKMKSKTNKKYGDVIAFDRQPVIEEDGINGAGAKKSKRGDVIMEGSRCSRVNGRGWRCCQPTLVGYSLCEHHLGKGRLRSMASARPQQQLNEENSHPLLTKKRSKVGVVKARSMSSLLSQI